MVSGYNASAQMGIDSIRISCNEIMSDQYVPDGQNYYSFISTGEVAEFYSTFYGNTTYRIVGLLGNDEGKLIISVYDQERNLLFSNKDFENIAYWNFQFENTLDCIIEAEIDSFDEMSGVAVLMIGFEK